MVSLSAFLYLLFGFTHSEELRSALDGKAASLDHDYDPLLLGCVTPGCANEVDHILVLIEDKLSAISQSLHMKSQFTSGVLE